MTNETDRELLELAAKAAGLNNLIFNHGQTDAYYAGSLKYMTEKHHHTPWNPLNDDGDALLLAVQLHLFDASGFMKFRLYETRQDPTRSDYDITRRAIVRAAAEIGKAML